MNTIQDLRHTLDREARALHDDHVVARTVAVRGRVRTVRRRRAAAAVAAAAVVVAGVTIGVTTGSDGPDPASQRLLAGQVAPAEMTSLGWTYAFDAGTEADGTAELRLEPSDEPRLVTWATEGRDQAVTMQRSSERPWASSAADFADFTVLHPGFDGEVSVTGEGEVALAVYELTDQAPEGYTRSGVTFRERVADRRLLDAAVGDPGQTDLEVEVPLPSGELAVPTVCSGGARGTWTHLSVDGREVSWGPGCSDPTFDPGAGGNQMRAPENSTGLVTVRVWVTDGEDGPVVDDGDLVLGVGVYQLEPSLARVARQEVDRLVEHDGHQWRLVDTTPGRPRQREVVVDALPGRETLVRVYFTRIVGGIAHVVRDGRRVGAGFGAGTGSTFAGTLSGEGTAGARLSGDPGPAALLGAARYERVD